MLIIERWILAKLSHHTFFSLTWLNQCTPQLLSVVNQKPFKQFSCNRLKAFEQIGQPELKPLPMRPCRYTKIKAAKVNVDKHIQYQEHLYSMPHHLVREGVEVHVGNQLMQIYFHNQCIASHVRKHRPSISWKLQKTG